MAEAGKNSREVLRDRLMDDKPKGVIGAKVKDLRNLQMKRLGSREPRIEKDRDRAKKDKDLLNAFFNILLTHNTKSSNKQTSHHLNSRQN